MRLSRSTRNGIEPRFATYKRSRITGVDYAVNRFYIAELGRFIQTDPIGAQSYKATDPQSFNSYAYALNDPIGRTGPSGLDIAEGCRVEGTEKDGSPHFVCEGEEIVITAPADFTDFGPQASDGPDGGSLNGLGGPPSAGVHTRGKAVGKKVFCSSDSTFTVKPVGYMVIRTQNASDMRKKDALGINAHIAAAYDLLRSDSSVYAWFNNAGYEDPFERERIFSYSLEPNGAFDRLANALYGKKRPARCD
jgi:RHS repeat-associated protein